MVLYVFTKSKFGNAHTIAQSSFPLVEFMESLEIIVVIFQLTDKL